MSNNNVPLDLKTIELAMQNGDYECRMATVASCHMIDIPLETIQRWMDSEDWAVRRAAMEVCTGRDVPIDLIERGLSDEDYDVRKAAMDACIGRDVPIDLIERGLNDKAWMVRKAAMDACVGKDVSVEIVERGLNDRDVVVRRIAMNVCKKNGIPIPVIRTIEPPALVYKNCTAGVIVVAEIPKDAQVRGSYDGKCRSDKAVIKDIIGDFFGEKVGISTYDKTTCYRVGDVVEVDDFDFSNEECSTGFHFFCTKEQAKWY